MRRLFALIAICCLAGVAGAQGLASDVNTVKADLAAAADKAFFEYHNDLFPGFLLHTTGRTMQFFGGLDKVLLSGPTHMAWSEGGRVRVAAAPASTGAKLDKPWIVVWFNGGKGWDATRFLRHSFNRSKSFNPRVGPIDVPWLVILQHPATAKLDASGLSLTAPGPLGHVVFMPLMGSAKLRPRVTARWARGLPADVVARADLWTSISRRLPVYVREDYQVDEQADEVRIRNQFEYYDIADDWKTKPLTIAPVSPVVGLALQSKFHLSFDAKVDDLDTVTHWGPYMAVRDAEQYTYTITGMLKYVDEEAVVTKFRTETPGFDGVRNLLLRRMRTAASGGADPRTAYSIDWGMGMLGAWMRAMSLIPEDLQTQLVGYIQKENLLDGYFLKDQTYQSIDVDISPRKKVRILAVRPRSGLQTYGDDLVKQTSRMPYVVWQYGHYSGDWKTVRAKYDMVRMMYGFNLLLGWSNVGPEYTAEHAKISAKQGPIGLARLGKQFDDQPTYDYGAYLLAKALLNEWVWDNAVVPYATKNAPWIHPTDTPWIAHQNHGYAGLLGLPLDQVKTYQEIPLVLDRFNVEELADYNDYYIRMRHKYFPKANLGNVYVTDLGDAASLEALFKKPLTALTTPEALKGQSHVSPGYYNYPIDLMELASEREYKRLYPKGTAEPMWRRGLDSLSRGQSWRQLVIAIRATAGRTGSTWPYPCWYLMNPPKRDSGFSNDALPFGYIRPSADANPAGGKGARSNWNSALTVWD